MNRCQAQALAAASGSDAIAREVFRSCGYGEIRTPIFEHSELFHRGVGETTVIGDDVTLFQGVTLGGTGKEHGKRHPTIGNHVSIGSGAKLLGNITIGENCRVGAGSVVLRSVPDNSTIVGVPGHIVLRNGKRVVISDPKDISDPLSDVFIRLAAEVHELREKLQEHTQAVLAPEPDLEIDKDWSVSDGAGI